MKSWKKANKLKLPKGEHVIVDMEDKATTKKRIKEFKRILK